MDVIPHIAARYRMSEACARRLVDSLRQSGGTIAQFDEAELGGPGQWMPGMTMVGDMGNAELRARVDGFIAELAAIVRGSESAGQAALSRPPNTGAASGEAQLAAGESWWPATFGHPAASGDQDGIRYAYFREHRRLLIQEGGRIDAYDTDIYHITGIGQRQAHPADASGTPTGGLTFTTRAGGVPLASFKRVALA